MFSEFRSSVGALHYRGYLCSLLVMLVVWQIGEKANAQVPPGVGYVFPPVVQIGTTTDVQMGVFDYTDDVQWFLHDDRVKLEIVGEAGDFLLPPPPYWTGARAMTAALPIPREVPARFNVPDGLSPGLVCWQLASANGPSRTAMVLLSGEREIVEARSRDFPQRLPDIPIAVSGRLGRLTEVDRYELTAERDGPISVTLMARCFGSDFRGVLRVEDSIGQSISEFADTAGIDGGLTFIASAGETYCICLHDVDFRGDRSYVYRLAIVDRPRGLCTIPAVGQRGTTVDVQFVVDGWNPDGDESGTVTQRVTFSADSSQAGMPVNLQTPYGAVSFTIPLSDHVEQLAVGDQTSKLAGLPAAVSGRFTGTDAERVSFDAEKGEHLWVELQSSVIGGSLDPSLIVLGPDGRVVGENEDAAGTIDCRLDLKVPEDGTYTCLLTGQGERRDHGHEVFRLLLTSCDPDFSLQIPQQASIPLGGKLELPVTATRFGGFDGEISLAVSDLPEGVSVEGELRIPSGQSEVRGILKCDPSSAVTASPIRVDGYAESGGRGVMRRARSVASGLLTSKSEGSRQLETCLLAITMNAPVEVLVRDRERQRDVHRGSTYPAELEIVRKDGFSGEVRLVMTAQQDRNRQGSRGETIVVPAGETKAFYPCFLPEWLATDITRRMIVHGVVVVSDPKGNPRHLTRPADARITMIMEGALLKVAADSSGNAVNVGSTFEIPFRVSRSAKLQQDVTVQLDVPEEIGDLVHADPVVLGAGTDRGVLRVESVADRRLDGPWDLRVVATALEAGRWPVISETTLQLEYLSVKDP